MQLHAYLPSYICNHYPCQNDLALLSFLAVSERLFTENILSHYDAEEKVTSHLLYFQKNVIELLLEKYLKSLKLIIRALFLQLTSGVDLFFTIVNLTKCRHITAMFLQMELILTDAVLQNLNRNISHT